MSEPVAKERPTVDLDDFERRLRQHDHEFVDPLAELARLVGEKHDPYGEVFAQEARAPQAPAYQPDAYHAEAHQPPVGADVGMSPRLSGDFAAIEAGLRGALAVHPEAYPHGDAPASNHEFYASQDQYAQHDQGPYLQDHEDQQWAAGGAHESPAAPPRAASRRPIYAMVATILVGVVGVGLAFAYKGTSSSPSEIRTIAAAAGPNKIQPPADASTDQAGSQDPAVLGKSGQPTRLVSGEEQPVDISQAVQENTSRNADAGGGQGDASNVPVPQSPSQASGTSGDTPNTAPDAVMRADQIPGFGMPDMPPPKKVKVVSVRPDGSIVSTDANAAADTQTPSMAMLSQSPGDDQAPPVAKAATPKSSTPKTKTTSRVSVKPVSVAKTDDPTDGSVAKPLHKAKLKAKVKPVEVASAEQTPDNAGQPASSDATRPSGGGFAVQLAAPGSEAEARATSSRLAKKFADALDGRRLGFHKAQSNGKSVFRVRVGSLSKDDATSLCEKLKAAGGSCFIAKNN